MFLLIVVVLAGNQVVISLFSRYTDKLILENHELFILEELKGSLGKILIEENHYSGGREQLEEEIALARTMLLRCRNELSLVHKGPPWEAVERMFRDVEDSIGLLFQDMKNFETYRDVISHQLLDLIAAVDGLILETVDEINEYETKSAKAKLHGTVTILGVSLILLLVLVLGGIRQIRSLTRPIGQLLNDAGRISQGDREHRVQVEGGDEFARLAASFNDMLDTLNQTSISEKYLEKILNHLYGALFVVDTSGIIRSINQASVQLLKKEQSELQGWPLLDLFAANGEAGKKEVIRSDADLIQLSERMKRFTWIQDSKGDLIPVYVASVVLRDAEQIPEGLVVVVHDLTRERENEQKIEKLRKERMIAFHEAQEQERLRISQDLHDGLGQLLTGISYSIQQLGEEQEGSAIRRELLQKQIKSAIQETRNISRDLTPIVLKDFGLVAAIENLLQRNGQEGRINYHFKTYSFDERIDERLEKSIYRICQEAISNIIKHANAREVHLELFREKDAIILVIDDDGRGFDGSILNGSRGRKGFGIMSIQERVAAFGGHLSIYTTPGEGTEIVIEIPCTKKEEG